MAKAVEVVDAAQQRIEIAGTKQSTAELQDGAEAQPRPPPWRGRMQSIDTHKRKPKPLKLLGHERPGEQPSGPRLLSNNRVRPRRSWLARPLQARPLGERKAAGAPEKQKGIADSHRRGCTTEHGQG